jgi:hypothetical protein
VRVLIACEFSGAVRRAFRAKGHDAWSCDLIPADDSQEFHIEDDVTKYLSADCEWDLMIAFPPCTHLAVSGARYFKDKAVQQEEAIEFVRKLLEAPIPKIALENPVGVISSRIRKPDQIIQPYEFGHDASKRTCLWLKGLPKLQPTKYVEPKIINGKKIWGNQTPSGQNKLGPSPDRAKIRSITYEGIAAAMADQWG